jgi:hypothetical protein
MVRLACIALLLCVACEKEPVVTQIELVFDPFTCSGSSYDLGCIGEAGLYVIDPATGDVIDSYCVSWDEPVSPPRTSLPVRLDGARLEGFAAGERVEIAAAVYPIAPTCVPPVYDGGFDWYVEPLSGLPALYYGWTEVDGVDSVDRITIVLECFVTVGDIGC